MSWEKSAEVIPEEQFLECVEAAAERWCKKYGLIDVDQDFAIAEKAFKAGAFYSHDYYSLYWLQWIEKGEKRCWQARNRVEGKIDEKTIKDS